LFGPKPVEMRVWSAESSAFVIGYMKGKIAERCQRNGCPASSLRRHQGQLHRGRGICSCSRCTPFLRVSGVTPDS
jgi:hypothetical protein